MLAFCCCFRTLKTLKVVLLNLVVSVNAEEDARRIPREDEQPLIETGVKLAYRTFIDVILPNLWMLGAVI